MFYPYNDSPELRRVAQAQKALSDVSEMQLAPLGVRNQDLELHILASSFLKCLSQFFFKKMLNAIIAEEYV